MRLFIFPLLLFLLSSSLIGQSLAAFQLLEACNEWQCVVSLAGNASLRLDRSIPWRLPLRRTPRLTSGFGYRVHPIEGERKFHDGVDIAAPLGSRVLAAGSGRVSMGFNRILGYYVRIDHLNGFISTYGHLDRVIVQTGDLVAQSGLIGTVGVSGRTTGPHLHWSIEFLGSGSVDPLELRRALMATL